MQNQHLPVLIFAQSGRFLAQSATQAGYTVWVADCFGDSDTIAASQRWLQLPPFSELSVASCLASINTITAGEPCSLICGSGIECIHELLNNLPDNVDYVGNSADTIRQIKSPTHFFNLLSQFEIPHPPTRFTSPKEQMGWLVKSATGIGGLHIQTLDKFQQISSEHYYQRYLHGESVSVLLLASKQELTLLSINKQSLNSTSSFPFRMGHIEAPAILPERVTQSLTKLAELLVSELKLVGLNSIDFLITPEQEVFVLEINPRPSASMELAQTAIPIIQLHIAACKNQSYEVKTDKPSTSRFLCYLYADKDYEIPETMIWPIICSDIPNAKNIIRKDEPICSYLVESEQIDIEVKRSVIKQRIIRQLIPIT